MNQVLEAQKILEEKYQVATDVWSVTSYNELRRDGLHCERWNLFHPKEQPKTPYIWECLKGEQGVFVAASDYMKALPDGLRQWMPKSLITMGTDGFGRSESRKALRDFFEVDAKHIVFATLVGLFKENKITADALDKAMKDLHINPEKLNPMVS